MRDVIQKIVASETEAKQLVQAANAEAARQLSDAQSRARAMVETARAEAKQEAEEILATAEAEGEKERAALIVRAQADIDAAIHLDEVTKQRIVTAAVRCLCGETP